MQGNVASSLMKKWFSTITVNSVENWSSNNQYKSYNINKSGTFVSNFYLFSGGKHYGLQAKPR